MARKTCYDLVHKLQFKFTLSGRYTTNMYVRDSSARSVFLSFANWTIYRYHSCRTPNICFSHENTGNENFKKSFHSFFHLSRQSGVSHTFDNLKIHRTIIIALVSNRLFLLSYLIFEGKVMGLDNTLFTFHYPIFQKVRFIWPMSKNKALHIKNKAAGSSSYETYY